MDARTQKLQLKLGIDAEVAQALVRVGLGKPNLIRNATDKMLEAVPGIGKATLERIRARVPRKEP